MAKMRKPEEIWAIVEKCIVIERAGGDVLAFLSENGYVTPGATWVNMQKRYMHRAQANLTSGKPTGEKRKGKKPGILPEAKEADMREWMRTHDKEAEGRAEGGAGPEGGPAADDPDVRVAGRNDAGGDGDGRRVRGDEMDTGKAVAGGCGELIATGVKSPSGIWSLQYMSDPENTRVIFSTNAENQICLKVREWQTIMRELPEVLKMMKIGR